jgi:hypothetical protein
MKKTLIAVVLVLCQAAVFSQDEQVSAPSSKGDSDIKTLFNTSGHKIQAGFFIGPEAAYTQFDGRSAYLGGMSLGVILDHVFSVGLAGYGILNSGNLWFDHIDPYDMSGAYLYGGYGGVKMEFRVLPSFPVHLNIPVLIGGGGLVYNTSGWNYDHSDMYDGRTIDWDAFFVLEPGVMMEVNILKFLRLDAGVTYRFAPGLDLVNTSSSMASNFNVNLSLKFGKF